MKIDFYVEKRIKDCKSLWNEFSKNEYLTDNWEYRLCFHNAYKNTPYFIVGKTKGEIIGFVPLEYDEKRKSYIFFGGADWNEQMRFLIKDLYKHQYLHTFIQQLPHQASLRFIHPEDARFIKEGVIQEEDFSYYLVPKDYDFDMETYLTTFSPRSRKNIRKALRRIGKLNFKIRKGRIKDFDRLINFNIQRYKKDSMFMDDRFTLAIKNLLMSKTSKFIITLVTVLIDNQVEAISLFAEYKRGLVYLEGSSDPSQSDVSRFLDYHIFEHAFKKKLDYIDALSGDCGWKERWRLKKKTLFKLTT